MVLDPLRVTIENYDELLFPERHIIKARYFPADESCEKFFEIPFTNNIYIERTDFIEVSFPLAMIYMREYRGNVDHVCSREQRKAIDV